MPWRGASPVREGMTLPDFDTMATQPMMWFGLELRTRNRRRWALAAAYGAAFLACAAAEAMHWWGHPAAAICGLTIIAAWGLPRARERSPSMEAPAASSREDLAAYRWSLQEIGILLFGFAGAYALQKKPLTPGDAAIGCWLLGMLALSLPQARRLWTLPDGGPGASAEPARCPSSELRGEQG